MSFLRSLPAYGPARDAYILGAIQTGNLDVPQWVDVQCGPVTLSVSADYLKIQGERVPMAAPVAQAACDALDALLPTPKIVEAIEAAATIVAMPTRPPEGNKQLSAEWIAWCEEETQRRMAGISGLVAGHRKDVVIVKGMAGRAGRVWIFGARWPNGKRIEVVAHGGHEAAYADTSHGTRAIRDACVVNGVPARVSEILRDPVRASWLSAEWPLTVVRYPLALGQSTPHGAATNDGNVHNGGSHVAHNAGSAGTGQTTPATVGTAAQSAGVQGAAAKPITPPSPAFSIPTTTTLRRGHRGPLVAEIQRRLSAAGFVVARDSLFGNATEAAVIELQSERGLDVDGVVGPQTRKALGWVLPEDEDTEPGDIYAPDFDIAGAPTPLSDAERIRLFGSFEWVHAPRPNEPGAIKILGTWVADNFTTITIPQLVGVTGAPGGRVFCHRKAAPTILRFFANVEKAGKKHLILTFDGCWNPRLIRALPHQRQADMPLSNHAWGTDIDLNARWNVRGTQGAPRGEKGSLVELYPIAVDSGMGLGINWGTPDPHHIGVLVPE